MKNNRFMAGAATLIVIAGIMSFPAGAHAQGVNTGNRTNFFQNLVQYVSDKLGLDKNKVQSVVNTYQQQRRQAMQQTLQQRVKSHLDQLVAQGKLTNTQETAVINKYDSLINKYNLKNLSTMTLQEQRTQLQNAGNELKSWAQSQGIDPTLITPGLQGTKWVKGMARLKMRMHPSAVPTAMPTP